MAGGEQEAMSGLYDETSSLLNGLLVRMLGRAEDAEEILMDVYMPEMNGYEATRIIRQINNEVIIIVETADKLSEVTEEFAGVKINDYLPKPYNKPYLNQLIMKHFNKKNKR